MFQLFKLMLSDQARGHIVERFVQSTGFISPLEKQVTYFFSGSIFYFLLVFSYLFSLLVGIFLLRFFSHFDSISLYPLPHIALPGPFPHSLVKTSWRHSQLYQT